MCDGGENTACRECMDYVATVGKTTKAKERRLSKPAHVKAPVFVIFASTSRFQWLINFIDYLRRWKERTDDRPGNFMQNAKSHMFISWKTYEGFQMTTFSATEATKFLLEEGMEFVLTEHLSRSTS